MKNLQVLVLFAIGTFLIACVKENPKMENTPINTVESSNYRAAEEIEIILSLEMSDEEIAEEINLFYLEHEPTEEAGTYILIEPNLEENIAIMSLQTAIDGEPVLDHAKTVSCGAVITTAADRFPCNSWAINLMRNSGCEFISAGYVDGGHSCYQVDLDCP